MTPTPPIAVYDPPQLHLLPFMIPTPPTAIFRVSIISRVEIQDELQLDLTVWVQTTDIH